MSSIAVMVHSSDEDVSFLEDDFLDQALTFLKSNSTEPISLDMFADWGLDDDLLGGLENLLGTIDHDLEPGMCLYLLLVLAKESALLRREDVRIFRKAYAKVRLDQRLEEKITLLADA